MALWLRSRLGGFHHTLHVQVRRNWARVLGGDLSVQGMPAYAHCDDFGTRCSPASTAKCKRRKSPQAANQRRMKSYASFCIMKLTF